MKKLKNKKIFLIIPIFLVFCFFSFSKNAKAYNNKIILTGEIEQPYNYYNISVNAGDYCVSLGNDGTYYKVFDQTSFLYNSGQSSFCSLSMGGQYLINGGNANTFKFSNNYGISWTPYDIYDNSSFSVDAVNISKSGQYVSASKNAYFSKSNDYGANFSSYDWNITDSVFCQNSTIKFNDNGVGIRTCDYSPWGTNTSYSSGIHMFNGSNWSKIIGGYNFRSASLSDNGNYFCAIALDSTGGNANRIYWSTDFPSISENYIINENYYKNCFVNNYGIMYLWNDTENGNVVKVDLTTQTITEKFAKIDYPITAFGYIHDNMFIVGEAGGYLWERSSTPATPTVPAESGKFNFVNDSETCQEESTCKINFVYDDAIFRGGTAKKYVNGVYDGDISFFWENLGVYGQGWITTSYSTSTPTSTPTIIDLVPYSTINSKYYATTSVSITYTTVDDWKGMLDDIYKSTSSTELEFFINGTDLACSAEEWASENWFDVMWCKIKRDMWDAGIKPIKFLQGKLLVIKDKFLQVPPFSFFTIIKESWDSVEFDTSFLRTKTAYASEDINTTTGVYNGDFKVSIPNFLGQQGTTSIDFFSKEIFSNILGETGWFWFNKICEVLVYAVFLTYLYNLIFHRNVTDFGNDKE